MSGTVLGNQARVSLPASLASLQNAAQLPRVELLTKLSSPELGSEFGQGSDSSLGSAGDSELLRILSQNSEKKRSHDKGQEFLGTISRTSPNQSSDMKF